MMNITMNYNNIFNRKKRFDYSDTIPILYKSEVYLLHADDTDVFLQ